jgi:hypothetical protein
LSKSAITWVRSSVSSISKSGDFDRPSMSISSIDQPVSGWSVCGAEL